MQEIPRWYRIGTALLQFGAARFDVFGPVSLTFTADAGARFAKELGEAIVMPLHKENRLPYGGMVKVPHFVVTHEAHEPVTMGGLTFTFIPDGIERVIEQAKDAAGDKKVSLLGASIDQQCLKAGLVDEIVIHLAPIVPGEGIRLFDHLGSESIELERTEVIATSGITSLRFRITK